MNALNAITGLATLRASAGIRLRTLDALTLVSVMMMRVSATSLREDDTFTLSVCVLLGHWGQLHLPFSQGQLVVISDTQTLLLKG